MRMERGSAKNDEGAVALVVASVVVVLFFVIALVVDAGSVYVMRRELQTAADAAALAGAQELPAADTAKGVAITYAGLNGVPSSMALPTTPYNGDPIKIKVVCQAPVSYTFARVLGLTGTTVAASAVAQKVSQWQGDALPFINLGSDYASNPRIGLWGKVSPGDWESIEGFQVINPNQPSMYFKVDYMSGVQLKKGVVGNKKADVDYYYQLHKGQSVYVISLSSAVIRSGYVMLVGGTVRSLSKLKNKDLVDPSQLVLLKCTFDSYSFNAEPRLSLTAQAVYNIGNNEFPSDYVGPGRGGSKLVE